MLRISPWAYFPSSQPITHLPLCARSGRLPPTDGAHMSDLSSSPIFAQLNPPYSRDCCMLGAAILSWLAIKPKFVVLQSISQPAISSSTVLPPPISYLQLPWCFPHSMDGSSTWYPSSASMARGASSAGSPFNTPVPRAPCTSLCSTRSAWQQDAEIHGGRSLTLLQNTRSRGLGFLDPACLGL
jgi:hypothetical protein